MVRIGINGFGRIGRLALRCVFEGSQTSLTTQNPKKYKIVQINELNGDARTSAHLLKFDSIHGRWHFDISSNDSAIQVEKNQIGYSSKATPSELDWGKSKIDLVIDATGQFKTISDLQPYFDLGAKKVLVACPVKDHQAFNIVMGVNDHLYDPKKHDLVTAASCTTNCLAPLIKVLHSKVGVRHGQITTIHDVTNTQTVVDKPHKDLRRARSSLLNLIPTSTGSASAIGLIFPELEGKLNGVAVRVPLLNASLTDAVLELEKPVDVEQINNYFLEASKGSLKGILGFEMMPLVSTDYLGDPRSCIKDGLSTKVVNRMQVKVLAWYRPDADRKVLQAQQDYVQKVGEECMKYDILFLFELLVYPLSKDKHQTKDYVEMKNKKTEHVLKSVEEFSNHKYGVDVFKLESPVNASEISNNDINAFNEMGKLAGRPWVMLSAGAGKEDFKNVLELAFKAGCSGFLAGRAIWLDAFLNYPNWDIIKQQLLGPSNDYLKEIGKIADNNALAWNEHKCYGKSGSSFPFNNYEFRTQYREIN